MNDPKRAVWFFTIAGLSWLLCGVLDLFRAGGVLEIAVGFTGGFIFLALAIGQAMRLRNS